MLVVVERLESGCHFNILSFVTPVVVGVILIMMLVHHISHGSVLATRECYFLGHKKEATTL